MGGQFHFAMEPQTTVCIPFEDQLFVKCSTQWIDGTQIAISRCLNIPECRINITVPRTGGAFGGKITRSLQVACACALGSFLTNRPVRFVMSLKSNITVMGKRPGLASEYSIDINDDGKVQKLKNDFTSDLGCSKNESTVQFTAMAFKSCYDGDSWNVTTHEAITNAPGSTTCRAPGTTEAISMVENIMEHIAFACGKDPATVRLNNIPADSEIKQMLSDFIKDTGF